MNTSELERRLGEVLGERAEEVMENTDAHARLDALQETLERDPAGNRTARIAVALAAAAAVVVAALVLVGSRDDDRSVNPAGPVDTQAAEAVAADFMAALAAYDAERAASYLADDAGIELRTSTLDAGSMSAQLRWSRAAGLKLLPGQCEHAGVAAPAVVVACSYDNHGLGSERLGRGPFTDNVLRLTVVDGKIVSGMDEWGTDEFEVTMWEPFTAWLVSADRADEWLVMFSDWLAMQPALTERSARLWEKNVDRYVRAVERGEAS